MSSSQKESSFKLQYICKYLFADQRTCQNDVQRMFRHIDWDCLLYYLCVALWAQV